MKNFSTVQKIVASVLSALVISQFSGCRTLGPLPRSEIQYAERTHYYVHGTNSLFEVSGTTIENGIFKGLVSHPAMQPAKGQLMHIYVAPDSVIKTDGQVVSLPVSNIAKAEIYKVDAGKTISIAAGAATGAFWTYITIVLIVKGISCPFVYSEDAAGINFEGEIYSGATATPLERDDYLRLRSITPVDERYKIRITNEVKEIQNTNLTELYIYDHPSGCEIIMDKFGKAHKVSDIRQPVTASNAYGKPILTELSACDDKRYVSDMLDDNLVFDTISLSFEKPENCATGKLVLSGKNTMWLDYMFGRLSDMFGNRHDEWKERRNKRTREDLIQWTLDQGIPLSVWVEKDAGLEFVDYFNVPGPVADKKDLLKIDLSGISGNKVNIKLVSGVLFWDMDFVGMDFTADTEPVKTVVALEKATDEAGKDVTSLLERDDDLYLVQPFVNNEASLSFQAPPAIRGLKRTVYLHSRGNYEVLREAKGKPDMESLLVMLQPGKFTRFAKDHFLQYYSKN
jgi:hypothetical protein